jgi:hypothetical protein
MNVYKISKPNSLKSSPYKFTNNNKNLGQLTFHSDFKDNKDMK